MGTTIAFVTYETRYAPCGGIQAVMRHLPDATAEVSSLPTIMITPYHHQIPATAGLDLDPVGTVEVRFSGRAIAIEILRLDERTPVYFLRPDDRQFFAGKRHPFDVAAGTDDGFEILLRDSLLFGEAVCNALQVIGPEERFMLMLQDWEAATCALALARESHRHRPFLTLHNSYDSWVSNEQLIRIGLPPAGAADGTVLQRALMLIERPVFTVSDQFALDLTEDPLQAQVMAPHLRWTLRSRLVGVCNGRFIDLAVEPKVYEAASKGDLKPLRKWKQQQKELALKALENLQPSAETPVWGDPEAFGETDEPWLVMAGRDDSRQKGYDLAAAAARTFLEAGGKAKFLFFPIPGDEGLAGLSFLRQLAEENPQQVIGFPFLWREGFGASLRGAAYGIMPSLYEPFGMASELYLNGTVGIARATGGLVQQIAPNRAAASFTEAVQRRTARWHGDEDPPTGFLFRERDDLEGIERDWRAINSCSTKQEKGYDRLKERAQLGLFQSIASELGRSINDALLVYEKDRTVYDKMLIAGVRCVLDRFTWEKAAKKYLNEIGLLDSSSKGG